jgi:catechol 2,3-dioxygenase-like lactoylglutathione lyase family enzyme
MARITGLNHLTLAVSDLDRSIAFYCNLLGFRLRARGRKFAYVEAGALWLCLSPDEEVRTTPHPDYTHVALSVAAEDFEPLADRIRAATTIWSDNRSEGASLYFLDPDGHKLELHLGSLESRLEHYRTLSAEEGIAILD